MSSAQRDRSDSEDDGDYIPPTFEQSSPETSEDEDQRQGQTNELLVPTPEDPKAKQKGRDALWASFQASVASSSGQKTIKAEETKMIKVQKRYLFAGEYITEVVEVPEDSTDAKKWPLYQETGEDSESAAVPEPAGSSLTTVSALSPKPPPKKPGPRKPKRVLGPLPSSSQKAKKLTTLDKSLIDWKAHTVDTDLQNELDTNRKGGGYLEKVEFLRRVEERKEENLEAMKSRKRRKL